MSKLVFVLGLLLGACLLSVCKCQRAERERGEVGKIESDRERGHKGYTHIYVHTLSLSSAAQNDEHRQYCGNITDCGPCVSAGNVSQTTHVIII